MDRMHLQMQRDVLRVSVFQFHCVEVFVTQQIPRVYLHLVDAALLVKHTEIGRPERLTLVLVAGNRDRCEGHNVAALTRFFAVYVFQQLVQVFRVLVVEPIGEQEV